MTIIKLGIKSINISYNNNNSNKTNSFSNYSSKVNWKMRIILLRLMIQTSHQHLECLKIKTMFMTDSHQMMTKTKLMSNQSKMYKRGKQYMNRNKFKIKNLKKGLCNSKWKKLSKGHLRMRSNSKEKALEIPLKVSNTIT